MARSNSSAEKGFDNVWCAPMAAASGRSYRIRGRHCMTARLQHAADHRPQLLIVIDDEDGGHELVSA